MYKRDNNGQYQYITDISDNDYHTSKGGSLTAGNAFFGTAISMTDTYMAIGDYEKGRTTHNGY